MWSNSRRLADRPRTILQLEVLESRNLLSGSPLPQAPPTTLADVQSALNTLFTDVKDLVSDIVDVALGKGGSANIPVDNDRIQGDAQTAVAAVSRLPASPEHIGVDLALFAIGDVLAAVAPLVPVLGDAGAIAKVGDKLADFGKDDLQDVVLAFFAEQFAPFFPPATGHLSGKVTDDGSGGCRGSATVGGTFTVAPQLGGTINVTFDLRQGAGICDDYSDVYTGSAVLTGGPISLVLSGSGADIFVNNLQVNSNFSLAPLGVETHGSGDWSFQASNDVGSGTFSF